MKAVALPKARRHYEAWYLAKLRAACLVEVLPDFAGNTVSLGACGG